MMTYFEELKLTTQYSGTCEFCGKKVRRTITVMQTLNPWNKKDGRLKTREEIYDELNNELTEARKHPIHEKCSRERARQARSVQEAPHA